MGDHRQGPGGGDGGVLLAQRARGRVAGVGEDLQERGAVRLPLQVAGTALLVEGLELLGGEIDLAAHLEQGGVGVTGQDQRDRGDGAHVAGDVLAGGTVTAGRGPGEDPVLVGQGHGQAVDLDLGGHGELVVADPGLGDHALSPLLDLVKGEDVLEGVHALVVRGGGEVGDGAPAHRAGRRSGSGQEGVGRLQPLQLPVEGVVVGVRQGTLGVDRVVVGVAGGLDVTHQLTPAFPGGGGDDAQIHGALPIGACRGGGRGRSGTAGRVDVSHGAIFPQPSSHRALAYPQ